MSERVVLLVEDNVDEEALIVRALQKTDPAKSVVVTHDGVEALDYLFGTGAYAGRLLGPKPALILLDLNLPKLDGLEVLRRVRADDRTRRLVTIMLTSSKAEDDLFRSYEFGANSYIRKPVDATQFSELMSQIGSYWLVLNEPPPS